MIHDGFKRKRSDGFMTSVIPSAREGTDVEDLLFQSGIESMHFLEKLSQQFKKKSAEIPIKSLSMNAEHQYLEEVHSIFHGGRYGLYQPERSYPWKVQCDILGLKQGPEIT